MARSRRRWNDVFCFSLHFWWIKIRIIWRQLVFLRESPVSMIGMPKDGIMKHVLVYLRLHSFLELQTTSSWWLFQLDDSKSLHGKGLFHQTSIKNWLFRVPGWYVSSPTFCSTLTFLPRRFFLWTFWMRPVSLHCVAAHGTMLQVGGGVPCVGRDWSKFGRSLVGLWKEFPSERSPESSLD